MAAECHHGLLMASTGNLEYFRGASRILCRQAARKNRKNRDDIHLDRIAPVGLYFGRDTALLRRRTSGGTKNNAAEARAQLFFHACLNKRFNVYRSRNHLFVASGWCREIRGGRCFLS